MDLSKSDRDSWTPSEKRTVLPNLELLFLTWVYPAEIDALLGCITTPNLTKLGLRGTPMITDTPWNALYDFLAASHPPLGCLSLGDFAAADATYLDVLKLCPELEYLTLDHIILSDPFFQALAQTDNDENGMVLIPNLKVFRIGVCGGFERESLLRFLRNRSSGESEGVSKLNKASILFCSVVTEDNADDLHNIGVKDLVVAPVEVDVTFPYARVVESHRDLFAYRLSKGETTNDEQL
jgi:hypothetical protein